MNGRGRGGRGGGYDGSREYGCGGSPRNVNGLNSKNSGRNNEGQQEGQGKGKGNTA